MSTAEAGMAWTDIAASAYRAYAASVSGLPDHIHPMLRWEDLPSTSKIAWEAAVRQADSCTRNRTKKPLDESRWTGWIPPHFKGDLVSDE